MLIQAATRYCHYVSFPRKRECGSSMTTLALEPVTRSFLETAGDICLPNLTFVLVPKIGFISNL